MRRHIVAAGVLAVAVAIQAVPASAKGSSLRFDDDTYRPGDRAIAQARVQIWPGSGQPEQGPYTVYLVPGRTALWLGHLPNDAVVVDQLDTDGLALIAGRNRTAVRLRFSFRVPRVADGRYGVWICRKECGANSMFGDLVYGSVRVSSASRRPIAATSVGTLDPLQRARTGIALAVLVIIQSAFTRI
jgi:hypothetical protein